MKRASLPHLVLSILALAVLCVPPGRALAETRDSERLHALLINGGGRARINYQSHLLHLRQMRDLLTASGVPGERISIFASDGSDPGDDVALRVGRANEDPDLWRVRGTRAWSAITRPVVYESSTVDGADLQPATQEALTAWFDAEGKRLEAGDTLLVYVTDHGNENKDDRTDNTITLWGEQETLSVSELSDLLARLDPQVRVVMLMSQCYSGSFANLVGVRAPKDRPVGNVCGYFSATADRRAYGCYPENLGRDNVGHSFRFINALADGRSMTDAHVDVVETDATPDVPLRTSDFYLEELLHAAAERDGHDYHKFVDGLLERAWADKARWEPEIRFLDRIGRAFGYFSPRSLSELDEQITRLPDIAGQMKNVSRAWGASLQDANQANFQRFAQASPDWSARITAATPAPVQPSSELASKAQAPSDEDDVPAEADQQTDERPASKSATDAPTDSREKTGATEEKAVQQAAAPDERDAPEAIVVETPAVKALTEAEREQLSREFLDTFVAFTRGEPSIEQRLGTLHQKGEDASAISYRMEVRLAVVLRMRAILTSIAGRTYVEGDGSDEQRRAYQALRECEDLKLEPSRRPSMALAVPEAFPPFDDDLERATTALPGWMGIRFADVEEALREKYALGAGASRVVVVYPDSPAEQAGLESGDIVLGPPGRPFEERREIRSWTMLSEIGEARPLTVLREDKTLEVALAPAPFPMKWPELPGPPEVGQAAPPVALASYRGDVDKALGDGPHLLFFWATWCAPCKASIPELLELEKTLGVPVIAITDEIPEQLDKFFAEREEFPEHVAIDRQRESFLAYGVSGTPTFVYVDTDGKVADYSSGYSNEKGLGAVVQQLMRQAAADE